jgi:hypothetical protein
MIPDTVLGDVAVSNPIIVLVPLAVIVVATILHGERRRLGSVADWVEGVRAVALPVFDPLIERYVGGAGSAYELSDAEYVGRIHESPEDVEQLLWNHGYRRNTLSAFKTTPDDREQIGAWVYRGDQVDDDRQVDTMLFRASEGEHGTDVYAHEEYSSALRWLFEILRYWRSTTTPTSTTPRAASNTSSASCGPSVR